MTIGPRTPVFLRFSNQALRAGRDYSIFPCFRLRTSNAHYKNHSRTLFALAGTASCAQTGTANPNTKLSPTSFRTLAQTCAANVPVSTLEAIARTESALYPYALSINRPHQLARRLGWHRSAITLERQ